MHLEALLDEFSNADGLDPKRRDRLQGDIRNEAKLRGVEEDLGLNDASSTAEAITRIDRFVCDIKESQFGDGLHIFGCEPETQHSFDVSAATVEKKACVALYAQNGLQRAIRLAFLGRWMCQRDATFTTDPSPFRHARPMRKG